MSSTKTFSFNHPWALLLILPLLVLLVMLVTGLKVEFNGMAMFALLFTLILLLPILYLGFFRWVRFHASKVEWITPRKRWAFDKKDVRHFGIVKYRAFKFIYLSTAQDAPFAGEDARVTPGPETIVLQYRKNAWRHVEEWLKSTANRQDQHHQ